MRAYGLTTKAWRLAVLVALAALYVPAFAEVLYVPVSPTVVAQTADPIGLGRKVSEAPFGDFRTEAHPGGQGCTSESLTCQAPYTFTGHLYDQESGLFYFGARYYDPETGRFLSQDPVAGDALNPPSLHKYLYAYSSPMNYTDPWGEYIPVGDDESLKTNSDLLYKLSGGAAGNKYRDDQNLRMVVGAVKTATSKNGAFAAMGTPELKRALNNWQTRDGINQHSMAVIDLYFHKFFDNLRQQDNYGFTLDEKHQLHGTKIDLTDQAAVGIGYSKAVANTVNPANLVELPGAIKASVEASLQGKTPKDQVRDIGYSIKEQLQQAADDPEKAGEVIGTVVGISASIAVPFAKSGQLARAAEVTGLAPEGIVIREPWEIPGFADLPATPRGLSVEVPGLSGRSLGAARLTPAKLTPQAKGKLGASWSREAAIARGDRIFGEEIDLTFNINGKDVSVRADVLLKPKEGGDFFVYVESKYSKAASFTHNQQLVVPELVRAGDEGLHATVGSRSGTLRPGQKIKVQFQGDIWNAEPTLLGQPK